MTYEMPIHKFWTKWVPNRDPPAMMWRLHDAEHMPVQYSSTKFGFFAQQSLSVQPKSTLMIQIPIGFSLRRGLVFVTLKNELRQKALLIPDGVISESVDNIVVSLQNNSDVVVTIQKGEQFGYVDHNVG